MDRAFSEAEALERLLGDPRVDDNPLSFRAARALDDGDSLREPFFDILLRGGFSAHYVPEALGGLLSDVGRAAELLRCIARRDVTTAHQLGNNFLGSLPVWIAGDEAQRRQVAARLLAGGRMAFGLTERGHGADVLANELTATRDADCFVLEGEKWLISQGATSDLVTVMARTGAPGDPRGFSTFLVDKRSISRGRCRGLPRVRTLGLRGADISGIAFHECVVPKGARVGPEGSALEVTIRTLLASKVVVVVLSLAAVDTALRTVSRFVRERVVYGGPVAAISHARTTIAQVFAELLVADACFRTAVRGVNVVPDQLSVHANVVKVVVPEICDSAIHTLSAILGARFYLQDELESGAFEKMLRDNAIVAVFDGNSIVCLGALAAQLPLLTRRLAATVDADPQMSTRLSALARLDRPARDLDFTRIELQSRGKDDLVQGLAASLARARKLGDVGASVAALGARFLDDVGAIAKEMESVRTALGADAAKSAELYDLARRYSHACAAAAAIHVWVHNCDATPGFFADGHWLELGLARLARRSGFEAPRVARAAVEAIFEEAMRRLDENQMFGIVPTQLARAGAIAASDVVLDARAVRGTGADIPGAEDGR